MSSATSQTQAVPEALDFYRVRDDLARQYAPANAFELMLITQMAQAWLSLQFAYNTQRRYFQARDVLEAIATQFEQYKAVTREVTNCERVWRHAMLHLEKTQRQRRRQDLGPRRPRPQVETSPACSPSRLSDNSSQSEHELADPGLPTKPPLTEPSDSAKQNRRGPPR